MQRLLGFMFSLALVFTLACTVSESPMTALDDGNLTLAGGSGSVNGSGNSDRPDTGTYRTITFNAQTKNGVTTGMITYVNRIDPADTENPDDPSTQVTLADVYCLAIVGNRAILGGVITRDDFDPSRVGLETILRLEDNGQGGTATGPDRITLSPIFDPNDPEDPISAQDFCDNPAFPSGAWFDVMNGNVTIRP